MGNQGMFTVPKDQQVVRVHLDRGLTLDGTIFLEYAPQEHSHHQRVLAFLENADGFFPLAVTEGAAPEFVNKRNIRMVEVEYPAQDHVSFSLMRILPVSFQFIDQTTLGGELMVDAPEEKSRLSDCLNTTHRFLCLRIGTKIYYVDKDAIRKVAYAEKR